MTETDPTVQPIPFLSGAVGNWQLDPSNTTIELRTSAAWGLWPIRGSFKAVDGYGTVGRDGSINGALVIDANSIDTRNSMRDMHLRNSDFFEVDRYPTLTYVATSMSPVNDRHLQITGALTVKGRSCPTDLMVKISRSEPSKLVLVAETEIDRSQWGISWKKIGAEFISRMIIVAHFGRPWYAKSGDTPQQL